MTRSLIDRARAGDGDALGQLLAQHTEPLLRIIWRLMGPNLQRSLEASDVLQETLLVAASRFHEFRGTESRSLTAWLVTLARRRLIDLARHNGRLKRALKGRVSLDEPYEFHGETLGALLAADTCTASQVAVKRELSGKLADALARIDAVEREVLRLRYVDGLTLESIGRRIGAGRNGVRGIVTRGLKSLRRLLPE